MCASTCVQVTWHVRATDVSAVRWHVCACRTFDIARSCHFAATQIVRKVAHVSSPFERAIADELLAEIARQRLLHREVQELAGVKSRAWSNYFIQRSRHIPMPVLESVARV